MKKFILTLIFLSFSYFHTYSWIINDFPPQLRTPDFPSEPSLPVEEEETSLVTPGTVYAAETIPSQPVQLRIERISVLAQVVTVGANDYGNMPVPSDNATASWWRHGAKPGQLGSAVIAGHFKIDDGSPGVFFRLNQIQVGDVIEVKDEQNMARKFEVVDLQIYPKDQFPLEQVYQAKDAHKLNLITCTGTYLPSINDYSHRLVVYAVEMPAPRVG